MESFPELPGAQRRAYDKLKTLFGLDHIKFIVLGTRGITCKV